jgi:hypothetical protein
VVDVMLRRAGDSAEALVELLEKHGFRPFLFDLRMGRFGSKFKVTAAGSVHDAIAKDWGDVLFAKPDSKLYKERIVPSLAAGSTRER